MTAVLKKQKADAPVGFIFPRLGAAAVRRAMWQMCHAESEYDLYTQKQAPPGQYRTVQVVGGKIEILLKGEETVVHTKKGAVKPVIDRDHTPLSVANFITEPKILLS